MKALAQFLVKFRKAFLILSIIMAIVCTFLIGFVNINSDQTKYLAADSDMRKGLEIINSEFPAVELKDSFQIMFERLTDSEKMQIFEVLKTYDGVTSVDYDINSGDYNTKTHTMYIVHTDYALQASKVQAIIKNITNDLQDEYTLHSYYSGGYMAVIDQLLPIAGTIMIILLLLMCRSYLEPILLLISVGIAVLINMGSNVIFESVSDLTFSIAAVLQLALSIDYSIILLHRFQQEYEALGCKNKEKAMVNAIVNSASSITSSSATTVAGLLVLLLMSFTIGADIGLVLAKGVFLSYICVFTVMPSIIICFADLLKKTDKNYLKQKKLARNGGEYDV